MLIVRYGQDRFHLTMVTGLFMNHLASSAVIRSGRCLTSPIRWTLTLRTHASFDACARQRRQFDKVCVILSVAASRPPAQLVKHHSMNRDVVDIRHRRNPFTFFFIDLSLFNLLPIFLPGRLAETGLWLYWRTLTFFWASASSRCQGPACGTQ
jgi:hypothetical protein